jgi:hypothetical protein
MQDVLKKRQLNFNRMFLAMGGGVFFEIRIRCHQRDRHFIINLNIAQRSLPRSHTHDGERHPEAGMVWAKNNGSGRYSDASIDGAGNMPRVDVSRMGDDDANRSAGDERAIDEALDDCGKCSRMAGIKTSCDSGRANRIQDGEIRSMFNSQFSIPIRPDEN